MLKKRKNIFYKNKNYNLLPFFISFSIFIFLLIGIKIFSDNYTINITSSLQRGIYKLYPPVNLKKNDIIVFTIPDNAKEYLYGRNYIPSFVKTMMKYVGAVYKDNIKIEKEILFVNNISWGEIKKTDSFNKPLPVLTIENLTPKENEILPLSPVSKSFDGRYVGTINTNTIINKASLVFSF